MPGGAGAERLRAFRFLLLLQWAVQSWVWFALPLPPPAAFPPWAIGASAVLLGLCAAVALDRRWSRLATWLAVPITAWQIAWTLPFTANHIVLAFVCLVFFAALDPDREDDCGLLLWALQWVGVIVLFHTGLQKLLHGYYFGGEFFSWMIAVGPANFGDFFGALVSTEEVARLRSYPHQLVGAGPYRVNSLALVFLSHATYLVEMILPVLMRVARTRESASWIAIAFVLSIQLAARELMFALLFLQLLLLHVERDWNRRLMPWLAAVYLFLLAAALGLVPADFLLKGGRL